MGTKDQEILNLIDEYFGQPEVYMWSTYILPNGHFLNPENVLKYAPDLETEIEYEHSDFTDLLTFFLEDGTEIPFYDVYYALDNNCIKINVTYPYLALPKNRVTNKQLQAVDTILKNYLDHLESGEWDGLMILAHKGSERLYDWTELLDTRQVIKDIRMSYVTGFLESQRNNTDTESNELKNLLHTRVGYREDNIGTSRSYKAIDILDYEYLELGNVDIIDTFADTNIIDIPSLATDEDYQIAYEIIRDYLETNYNNHYAFWLCDSIPNLVDNYIRYRLDGGEEQFEVVVYEVPEDAIILSDLGSQGILLMSSQPQQNYVLEYKEITKQDIKKYYRTGFLESTQTKITDDLGRPLSKEQQNYFKNSKVRDANGNLLTVYHGTLADFTVFNNSGESTELGYHFGTKEAAKARNSYRVLESYLNITKPLEAPEDISIWDAFGLLDLMLNLNMIPDLTEREYSFLASLWNSCGGCDPDEDLESWAEMQGLEVYDGLLDYDSDWFDTIWVNEYMPEILEIITSRGYDGIYYINAVEDAGHISWIAFYPEQIKLVTNKTPTNSKDITESTNNKVLKTVEYKGFKIEVPDNLTLYHGTAAINEESIKLHGLDPRFSEFVGNYVWLETHYNTAVNWGKMHARDVLVYAVDVKDLDINLLELDYYNYEYFDDIITEYGYLEITDITFIYKGNIPPEALYLVD